MCVPIAKKFGFGCSGSSVDLLGFWWRGGGRLG